MTISNKRRKRSRQLRQATSLLAAVAIAGALALWSARTSTAASAALTVVGVQPRSGEALAVDSNVMAELHATTPGDIVLYAITNPGGPVSRESTACSPDVSLYACQKSTAKAAHQTAALVGRLSSAEPSGTADPYALVRYTATFSAAHPHSGDVVLWLNLASAYTPNVSDAAQLPEAASAAVASGAWPATCRGFTFHVVTPSTGQPHQDALGRAWWTSLVHRCHGHLATYTTDWLGYGTDSWNLPKVGHGVISSASAGAVTFTLPAAPNFALNSATLSAAAEVSLKQVAKELTTRFAGLPVEVLGYTDASGTPEFNDALSAARASAVANWLTGPGEVHGVPVTPHGLGATDLLSTPEASRRVEIVAGTATLTATS